MRGRQESGSSEDIDRADVLVVSQSRFRRADDPFSQLLMPVRTQLYTPF
ncbi:MAG: hypothetical protein ABSH05_10620 [Bryobacteraceae bacterium]